MMKSLLFIMSSMVFLACNNYGKGVRKDTEKNIIEHKKFMRSLSFKGVISERKFCEACEISKYQLKINMTVITPETINLGNQGFQPYYTFDSAKQLTLSVTKNLFEFATTKAEVEKIADSDSIKIGNHSFSILSPKRLIWMPEK